MFKYHILLHFCIHIIENVQNISQHISCLIFKTITYCRLFLKWISVLNWLAIIHFALKIQKKYRILSKTLMFFRSKLVFSSTSWKKVCIFINCVTQEHPIFTFFKMIHNFRKHRSLIFCCSRIQSSEVFVFAQWCLKLKEYFFY